MSQLQKEFEELDALRQYTSMLTDQKNRLIEHLDNQDSTGKSLDQLQQMKSNLMTQISQYKANISRQQTVINNKESELHEKMERAKKQKEEIEYKKNLISTRNRMLQLSQEKNIYKQKVIYSLIAVIIFITLMMLVLYVRFNQ